MSVVGPERIESAMPFPDSPRVIYTRNPLVEVICQLRFPTILRIGAEQPADFQERLRRQYPLYTAQEPSLELPQVAKALFPMVREVNLPTPSGLLTHRFATSDPLRFISLSQDFVALTEKHYERWEEFCEEMRNGERALMEVYNPAFYTRVGLRYIDVISRTDLGLGTSSWSELLQPHIVAELGADRVSSAVLSTRTESVIQLVQPPDGRVKLVHGLGQRPETGEQCYVIDADFFVARKDGLREPFDILDGFNRLAGRLFRWAITPGLHEAMGPRPI